MCLLGGVLPLLNAPLPPTPGHVLHEVWHAGEVWTTAPWSACVLAAHEYTLDGRAWVDEIRWMAANSNRPIRCDWRRLCPHQIACKLLVMWKVWWWPHWSALPFLETVVDDDQDDQSFAQYSLPPNPDLFGPYWDRAVWDPFSAWAVAYSAYFKFHIQQVAGSAASVLSLYSLALCFVFDWFQCAREF